MKRNGNACRSRRIAVLAGCLWCSLVGATWAELDIADSQHYFDDRFAFSIDYPAGWHVEIADENEDHVPDYVMKRSIYFKSNGPATFMVYVWSNRDQLDLISWFNANYIDLMSYPEEAPTEINAQVHGMPAVRFANRQMTTCDMDIVLFQYGEWVYTLLYRNCDANESKYLFDHFVATFAGGL